MNDKIFQVSVSGPAASGKGTLSRRLATIHGLTHVDAGSIFRFAAYCLLNKKAERIEDVVSMHQHEWNYIWDGSSGSIKYKGTTLLNELAERNIALFTAKIASEENNMRQLKNLTNLVIGSFDSVIVDGRNAGSTILSEASVKFYVTAEASIRAKRRAEDLRRLNISFSHEEVLGDILKRDSTDETRKTDPLCIPKNAVLIRTDHESIEQVIERMSFYIIRERG